MRIRDIPEKNKHGNCFQAAYDYLIRHPDTILVHGVVTGQGAIKGVQYTHAWIEDGDTVIDKTIPEEFSELPKMVYYSLGNIKITRRYTYKEALQQVVETEHYGPWDKVFDSYL